MLVPIELSQRVQQAQLVVEARVTSQQAERRTSGLHIATRNQLEVYKVFKGTLPPGQLSVLTAGGTLYNAHEKVTSSLHLRTNAQGIFFLEADPASPGEWRAYAGPQGFIQYDVATAAASDPFGRYPALTTTLYPTLTALAGMSYRTVQPNEGLDKALIQTATKQTAWPLGTTAVPTISNFTPTTITAGTSTSNSNPTATLIINGAGFGTSQGAGFVEFRNADDPGTTANPNYIQPLASDYLDWNDTQIKVRVPSASTTNNTAGTGLVRVTTSEAATATSPISLTVTYALNTVVGSDNSNIDRTYRIRLVGIDGSGGYTLHYSPSFVAVPAAQTPLEAALRSWHCATSMNRPVGATTSTDVAAGDGLNVVRFGTPNELPVGVLGVTDSYYSGCTVNGVTNFQLIETDYTFAPTPYPGYTWNYSSDAPTTTQYDFQSVVLHELGHGQQLSHIISSTGVMNYVIGNGQAKRTLDASTDLAGGNDVIAYSTNISASARCNYPAFATSTSGCTLPVELLAFEAIYTPGQGTRLSWTTASEKNSAAFIIESQEASNAGTWQDIARVAAAGTSTTTHPYAALDSRPLGGTRYYRLRQLDHDGTSAYSPMRTVQGAEMATLTAYPNPAAGVVQLRGPLVSGATAQVRLLDATGRCVVQQAGPARQAAFNLPLAGVPAGLYLIEWLDGPTPYRTRLVVQ
jgi:hypothetical protein